MRAGLISMCLNIGSNTYQKWGYTSCQKIHSIYTKKDNNFHQKIIQKISLYSSESPNKCWQCDYPYKSELFCQKCETLQKPPENLDYFEILGIKKNYDIESKELHKKYTQLQNILHPDRFGKRTEVIIIIISLFFFN